MILSIQAPQAADREQWQQLYYGYAEFYKVPMNHEILDSVWSWIHDPEQAFYCLIAKNAEGKAVGLMHFRAMPSPLRGAKIGFLDDLFVTPSARGQGIVEQLFEQLNSEAQSQGWPMVRWITADNNYRGRTVYDKLAEKTQWNTYQMNVEGR